MNAHTYNFYRGLFKSLDNWNLTAIMYHDIMRVQCKNTSDELSFIGAMSGHEVKRTGGDEKESRFQIDGYAVILDYV